MRNLQPYYPEQAGLTLPTKHKARGMQSKLHTEAMGFGDYLNDMSLLESCGESYCMKNGHPTLKALAKYVTEKTNDENGVMEGLKTL